MPVPGDARTIWLGGGDAIELRHIQIEQRDIGPQLPRQLDRFATVFGFTGQLQIVFGQEHHAQAEAKDGMIVGDQHANRGHSGRPSSGRRAVTVVPAAGSDVSAKRAAQLAWPVPASKRLPRLLYDYPVNPCHHRGSRSAARLARRPSGKRGISRACAWRTTFVTPSMTMR